MFLYSYNSKISIPFLRTFEAKIPKLSKNVQPYDLFTQTQAKSKENNQMQTQTQGKGVCVNLFSLLFRLRFRLQCDQVFSQINKRSYKRLNQSIPSVLTTKFSLQLFKCLVVTSWS